MNKLMAFVRLDFVTVKPYFTLKNLLLYAVIIIFVTVMTGNVTAGFGFCVVLGSLFSSYPFALGEKSNMDALYATLSVTRKTVVLGRYFFALLLDAFAILVALSICAAQVFLVNPGGQNLDTVREAIVAGFFVAAFFIFFQSIQIPVYFKLGYTKAKFFSLAPHFAFMSGFVIFGKMSETYGELSAFFLAILNSGLVIPIVTVVLAFFVFFSYRVSIMFYRKREF